MLKLHGFAQSGNTFKVAFLLRALGVPWQAVGMSFADFAAGAARNPAWRESVNAMEYSRPGRSAATTDMT